MDFLRVVPVDADYSGQLLHEIKDQKVLDNCLNNKKPQFNTGENMEPTAKPYKSDNKKL
ncbi:MAG: hypothetical protein ACQETE_14500 [Bacteroidota bacterium]